MLWKCISLTSNLENFGFVLRDCSKVISINPRSSKAHYRSAIALLSLERYEEALDCCTRCLDFDPSNTSVRQLLDRAQKGKLTKEKKMQERIELFNREAEIKRELQLCFKVSFDAT
jgi:tetratricopeptide (TPR) repeat protein